MNSSANTNNIELLKSTTEFIFITIDTRIK